jgi:colicin import membrane protein
MKKVLFLITVLSACGLTAEAGHRSCCVSSNSNCPQPSACSTGSGSSTRWYKAKDGTFREMMPYMDALSRAEDADDMEIVLKGVRAELTSAKTDIETLQADAAKLKTELESQIAELKMQLESEKSAVAAQKERGDKAEAAHKQSVEQIATLRDSGKKSEETLKATQGELKNASEERDALKTARVELEKKLGDMTADMDAAKKAADEAAKVSQQEIEKLKQEAAEAKKAAVEAEAKAKEAPKPDEPKPETDAPAADNGEKPAEEPPKN